MLLILKYSSNFSKFLLFFTRYKLCTKFESPFLRLHYLLSCVNSYRNYNGYKKLLIVSQGSIGPRWKTKPSYQTLRSLRSLFLKTHMCSGDLMYY